MKKIQLWGWTVDDKECLCDKTGLAFVSVREAEKIIDKEVKLKNVAIKTLTEEINRLSEKY